MKHLTLLLGLVCAITLVPSVYAEDHKHHHHEGDLKKNSDKKVTFFKQDAEKKTVYMTVIAAYNAVNFGMNFNGHAKGKAIYKVPTGWTVHIKFENWSPVPHSLVIVEEDRVRRPQVGEAYFEGANSPNPTMATAAKEASFSFVVDEAGDFAFACGFPAHSANGQWIKLEVSDDFNKAEYLLEE